MSDRISGILFAILLCWTGAVPAATPVTEEWVSADGHYIVSYASRLSPIEINRIHSWELHVENTAGQPVEGAVVTLDGGMPEHNHGLATAPGIEPLGGGDYLVEGLRFHMMGYWEMAFTIAHNGVTDTVVVPLDL